MLRTADAIVMCGVGMQSHKTDEDGKLLLAAVEGRLNAIKHR